MSKDSILIVDDERFFCNLLQSILENDYHIFIANNRNEAIEALKKYKIDLILLDIVMPDIDGYQICKEIKQNEQYSEVPIIFLTVKNEIEDELNGFNSGAVDYITKPISPPIVTARVETHIALAKATKKIQQHAVNLEHMISQRTVELTKEIAEKQKVYEKLHYLANYDQLTLLPNRNLFNERLTYVHKAAKRNSSAFALLLIDLDRFKTVNDSLGHHIGDLLLEQAGQRLSSCLRDVDSIARLGGDEFTVIITELQHKEDAAIVANKIIATISQPFEIHGQIIHIGCSIGITCYPADGKDLSVMLKNSDMAMYEVKRNSKNAYTFFTPEMNIHTKHRVELEKDIYQAMSDNDLYLQYQPIINLKTNKICTVEALLRWKHSKHGQVPPDKIISIAEESDLILVLGEWVFEEACKQLSKWKAEGFEDLHIAINMSSRQFDTKFDSAAILKKLINQYNIPKNHIHLEITEGLMLENSKFILDKLFELKEMGILLAIDDFGTGYSSLSYLRKFPVDILKIDQSFIRELTQEKTDNTLIKTIIAMGKNLNLAVIAEGVEYQDQLTFLNDQGCNQVQGYYFSKPIFADEISILLENEKKD